MTYDLNKKNHPENLVKGRRATRNSLGQGRFCGIRALRYIFRQKHKKK